MQNRSNNMGTLHLLGACFVMYGHYCVLTGNGVPIILGSMIQAVGVKVIFLISGYLITRSLYKQSGNKFKISLVYSLKRIGRIWPEFLVCLMVSSLVIGPLFTNLSAKEYWGNPLVGMYFLYNLRLFIVYGLPGVFESNPYPNAVNGSLWTIPVEIALYILIWILYIVTKSDKSRKLLFGAVSMVMIVAFLIRISFFPDARVVVYGTDWIQALNVAPYFMIGGCAYLYDVTKYINVQVSAILLLIFGGIYSQTQIINEAVCLVVLSYFILSMALTDMQGLRLKKIHSEYAYGMYLYGFVIQQCIIQKLQIKAGEGVIGINGMIVFLLSLIGTYTVAMLSNKLVYRPVSKIISKIIIIITGTG